MSCSISIVSAFIFLLFLSLPANGLENDEDPLIVTTPMGKIQGSIPFKTASRGENIYSFRGIRYAKPPIGDLRFKPPVATEKYDGVYNATVDGKACSQSGTLFEPTSEDCLFLNVYTTQLPKKDQHNPTLAVIVHIHPGAHLGGTARSDWDGPQYFMDRSIVLVTFNYRLGSLGMLSTGDELAPGNNAFKDQVLVLKWVQKNIEAFGGDPTRVTLMGYSAGSRSVYLHMVSPMSKGLFSKAIANSGSPLPLYKIPTSQLELAKRQARLLNCPDDNSEVIIKCLKTKSAEEIGNTYSQLYEFANNPNLLWVPVIEKDYGQERFLPDHPINLIEQGKIMDIPLLTGITKDAFKAKAVTIVLNDALLGELDRNWEEIAPILAMYERNTTKSKLVSERAREFYVSKQTLTNSSLEGLAEFISDGLVGYPIHRMVKLLSKKSKSHIYSYLFSYQGNFSTSYYPGTNIPTGVTHGDDNIYIFYTSKIFPLFNASNYVKDFEMVTKLTTLYANFALTGIPTLTNSSHFEDWVPYSEKQEYLDIGDVLHLKEKLNEERYDFWETLHPYDKI